MKSKASITVGRTDFLLKIIGQCASHRVGNWVAVNDLFETSQGMATTYCTSGNIDEEMLWHDLRLLMEQDLIRAETQTGARTSTGAVTRGAAGTWKVVLEVEGLKRLAEIEKWWLRRAYEKNPPAWWMVLFTLGSFAVAIVALLKSFGAFDPRP